MDTHMSCVCRSSVLVSARYHHNPSRLIQPSKVSQGSKILHAQSITIDASNSNTTHNRTRRSRRHLSSKRRNDYRNDKVDYVELVRKSSKGNLDPRYQTQILKQAPTWQKALSLLRLFQANDNYKPNIIHYNIVLRFMGKAGCWDELKFLWDEIREKNLTPTIKTYGTLIDIYSKAGLRVEALEWLKRMEEQGIMRNEVIVNTVVYMYVAAGDFEEAEEFYRRWMESHPEKPKYVTTYNTLIAMYGKAGRLDEAAVIFSEMLKSGFSPDNFTFNTLIHICGRNGDLEEAKSLMNKMEVAGYKPDVVTYNTLIGLHVEEGNMDMAMDYLSRMKQDGLRPDVCTYRILVFPLCAKPMIREVEFILDGMGMDELRSYVDFLSPSIVRMYVGISLVTKAWAWFETFQDWGGISSTSYAAIIDAFGELGYWLQAEKVFDCCIKTVEKHSVLEFNVMIKAYGIAELYDRALDLFESMESYGLLPDECTYNSIIQMLATADSPDDAKRYMIKMQEVGFVPSLSTVNAVISANLRLARPVEAEMIYKEMIKMGIEPDIVTYATLINAFAEIGNMQEAARYLDIMEKAGIAGDCDLYRDLVKGYGKVGWVEGAQETYEKMRKLGDYPDVCSANSMISLYSQADMIGEAELIFNDLKEAGLANECSFASILNMYKKIGRFDKAFNIAKEIQDLGLLTDPFTFNVIIGLYTIDARLKEAIEVYQQMLEVGVSPDEYTYKNLRTILEKGGIPTEIVNQLEIARESGIPHSKHAWNAGLYSVAGMHEKAVEACEQLKDINLDLDISAYNVGIYALGSAGKTVEAFNMFRRMQTKWLVPDVATNTAMLIAYSKAGLVQGVTRMINKIRCTGFQPDTNTYRIMIDAYKSIGKFDLARQASQEMHTTQDLQEQYDFREAEYPSLSEVSSDQSSSEVLSRVGRPSSSHMVAGKGRTLCEKL